MTDRPTDFAGHTADLSFSTLLKKAKQRISEEDALRVHPLRDTHINDVPVVMAIFAGELAKQANLDLLAERDRLKDQVKDLTEICAGSSLCKACQQKREERRIIATPRIQVEEERDRLNGELVDARRYANEQSDTVEILEARLSEFTTALHDTEDELRVNTDENDRLRSQLAELREASQRCLDKFDREGLQPGFGVVRDWLRTALANTEPKE
jgi:hypothetical protein